MSLVHFLTLITTPFISLHVIAMEEQDPPSGCLEVAHLESVTFQSNQFKNFAFKDAVIEDVNFDIQQLVVANSEVNSDQPFCDILFRSLDNQLCFFDF